METLRLAVKSGGYDAIASATNPIDIVNGGGDITINRDSTFWPHRYYVRIYRGALQPEWGPRVEGEESVGMHLLLEDSNRTAIQSTDLPLTPPDLNDFTSTGVNLFFGNDGYDDASAAVAVTLTSLSLGRSPQAQIDVIPGSASNEVSPVSDDAVPVAILGSDTFGVGQVDLSTLAFGRAKASPLGTPPPEVTDVNGDGFLDLVAYYRGDEAGIDLDDRAACLEGERLDGSFFQGCDAMTPVYPSVPILPPGLYGVTGDGASLPEALFMLDRGDATPSFAALLGRNRGGETIGFDPDDGLLYRASGQVFEAISRRTAVPPPRLRSRVTI